LISKKNFKEDEKILMEKPFVSCQFAWNQFYQYKACEYCLRPLESAEENVRRLTEDFTIKLPYLKENCTTNKQLHCVCEQCGLEYCSIECKQSALNEYHQVLCLGQSRLDSNHPYNVLMDTWRQLHLPPETTSLELIIKMIAHMKQAVDKTDFMKKLNNFECNLVNEQEQLPHKLLSANFFSQIEYLREVTNEFFNQHLYVKECESWLTKQGFRQLFSLIGRNSQGIGTSPLSVWVENCDAMKSLNKKEHKKLDSYIDKLYEKLEKVSESFLNSEGSGLYELQSMINHSCRPNAEIKFQTNNNVLTLVALRDIKPGEEIFISYLDECELARSRHSRQKLLKENYLFACQCELCLEQSDHLDVTSDEDLEEDDDDDNEEAEEEEEDEEAIEEDQIRDENNNIK